MLRFIRHQCEFLQFYATSWLHLIRPCGAPSPQGEGFGALQTRSTNPNLQHKKGAPIGAPMLFLAAAAVVVAAVSPVAAVVTAATAAVAEDQQQDDDPPPVVAAEAGAHIVVTAHKIYLRFWIL